MIDSVALHAAVAYVIGLAAGWFLCKLIGKPIE